MSSKSPHHRPPLVGVGHKAAAFSPVIRTFEKGNR